MKPKAIKYRVEGSFQGRPVDFFEVHADSPEEAHRIAEASGIEVVDVYPGWVKPWLGDISGERRRQRVASGNGLYGATIAVAMLTTSLATLVLCLLLRPLYGLDPLFFALGLGAVSLTIAFHTAFARGVARDAVRQPNGTELVSPGWWVAFVLIGGVPAAVLYWLVNCSSLRQPSPVRRPEEPRASTHD